MPLRIYPNLFKRLERRQQPFRIRWTRPANVRWSSVSQRPGSDHVRFPGAVDSKFTTALSFEHPSTHPAIPTYRFMDSDGVVVDQGREPNVSDEEVLTWYNNMLTGMQFAPQDRTTKR
ncbi:MAG: hypothetical protein Q9188_007101 [Gyalolechia gomerana]